MGSGSKLELIDALSQELIDTFSQDPLLIELYQPGKQTGNKSGFPW